MIVAHEVTNVGHDRTQLPPMSRQVQQTLGLKEITVIADRGYFSSVKTLACDEQGITPLVPKPLTSNNRAQSLFDKRDFIYLQQSDEYLCPVGERARWRFQTVENGMVFAKYWSSSCPPVQ